MTNATTGTDYADLTAIADAIARSRIVVAKANPPRPPPPLPPLPAGFDDVDLAILEWIVAEARFAWRDGRGSAPL